MAVIYLYLLAAALVINCVTSASDTCTEDGKLEFISKSDTDECPGCTTGPLRICEDTLWKRVCDIDFTSEDVAVACRSLGYSPEGAMVFSFPSTLPDPTQSGFRCTGTEAQLSDCPRGDADTNEAGVLCLSRLRVVCRPPNGSGTSEGPTTFTTVSMEETTGTNELDVPLSSSTQVPLATGSTSDQPSSTYSSAASGNSQQNFLNGSGLYIFIGGVGAVVVAIMVLVQILLTCWCCLRYRHKEISPIASQESKGADDQLDGSNKIPTTTSTNSRSKNHHQLQQSPPKATNPIYYSLEDGGSGQRVSALYAELDRSQVYAQLEPCGPSSSPTAQAAEPTYQSVQSDPSYQLLQHKNSMVSKSQRKPPRPVDEERIRQERLEFLQLQDHRHQSEASRQYDMPEGSKGEDSTRDAEGGNMYHSLENPGDNVYQTIESPPDYATLENPNEPASRCKRRGTLGKKDSSDSQVSAPPIPSRDRTPSKSSIFTPRDTKLGSHSSSSLSSSSSSQTSDRSSGESAPLMTQSSEHQDGSIANSIPPSLSVVNQGPRAVNKYTESPVPTRKELLAQQHELQIIPRQLQGSPVIPDPNDLPMIPDPNGLYTLV